MEVKRGKLCETTEMMEVIRNKYVVTKSHIDGVPNESDFSICEELLSLKLHSHVSNNVVIVKNLYVSIDPYQINRMKTYSSSHKTVTAASAVLPGQAIEAGGVGRVVESWHPDFKKGEFVSGVLNWGEYSVVEGGHQLQKLDTTMGFPLSYYAGGVLGPIKLESSPYETSKNPSPTTINRGHSQGIKSQFKEKKSKQEGGGDSLKARRIYSRRSTALKAKIKAFIPESTQITAFDSGISFQALELTLLKSNLSWRKTEESNPPRSSHIQVKYRQIYHV